MQPSVDMPFWDRVFCCYLCVRTVAARQCKLVAKCTFNDQAVAACRAALLLRVNCWLIRYQAQGRLDANDLVSCGWISLLNHCEKAPVSRSSFLLFDILAKRVVRDEIRRRCADRRGDGVPDLPYDESCSDSTNDDGMAGSFPITVGPVASPVPPPGSGEEILLEKVLMELEILQKGGRISERQKIAFLSRRLREISWQEICQNLGIAKAQLFRDINHVQKELRHRLNE